VPGLLSGDSAHAAAATTTTPGEQAGRSNTPGASSAVNTPGRATGATGTTSASTTGATTSGTTSGTTTTGAPTASGTGPTGAATAPGAPPAGCPNVKYSPYSLGPSYAGLPLTYSAVVCNQPPSGAGPAVPFTDVIYGTCHAVSDAGCPAPLEIQSWPECQRNYGSYSKGSLDQQMNPSVLTTIGALPSLPAAVFDGGSRLEMYTGDTTVVLFGDNASQLMTTASALVPRIAAKLLARSPRATSVRSASAMKAAIDTTAAAQVLRAQALGTPPPCAAG
jgi:hypothetical protein